MEIQAQYTSGGDKVHMCYSFEFLSPTRTHRHPRGAGVDRTTRPVSATAGPAGRFPTTTWCATPRAGTSGEDAPRLYAGLLLCLRGSVCLYQGEELGLTEAYVAYEDLQDPYGIRFWPKFKGRDGCRTPIPWVQDNQQRRVYRWQAVAARRDGASAPRGDASGNAGRLARLHFYRRDGRVPEGASAPLPRARCRSSRRATDYISLIREHDGQRVFCAFNLSNAAQPAKLPDGDWRKDNGAPFQSVVSDRGVTLPPYQAYFGLQSGTTE